MINNLINYIIVCKINNEWSSTFKMSQIFHNMFSKYGSYYLIIQWLWKSNVERYYWIRIEIFGELLGITVTKVWQICSHTLCHWRKSFQMLVGRRGLEPRTTWLKVRCSTSWATDPQGTFKTSRESKKVNK